jgi:predicted phosphodiesterase
MLAFLSLFFIFFFCSCWRFRFVFPRKYRYHGALLFTLLFTSSFVYRAVSNDFIFVALAAIGAFTIVFLVNWIVFCLFWDLYLGIRRLLGKRRLANKRLRMRQEPKFASGIAALTLAFFLIGVPSQQHFRVTTVKENLATAPKKILRIALFSDIHFDALFQKSKLERMLDSLRIVRPDAIFFAGDLSDISMDKLQERGYDSLFSQITAPLGFYVATGNHESFMNPNGRTIEWLQNFDNVTLLMDNTVCNDFFCVTGRLDHQYAERHSGGRIPLEKLTPANDSIPWFLIDHQPKGLESGETGLV